MDELNRDPREDISLIKEMLEKAMDDITGGCPVDSLRCRES